MNIVSRLNAHRKTALVAIVLAVVFVVPIIPQNYYIPYREEVPILVYMMRRVEIVNTTGIEIEGGGYKFWHRQVDDYKIAEFHIDSSEAVDAAVLTLEEFEAFQTSLSISPGDSTELGSRSIELDYQVPFTETYFFVIYNPHDGTAGEELEVTVESVTLHEAWEEESMDIIIDEGVRNMTAYVTLWQLITGSTPVY